MILKYFDRLIRLYCLSEVKHNGGKDCNCVAGGGQRCGEEREDRN